MYAASRPLGVVLNFIAPLAGPTSNSPTGINDALPCVEDSPCSTNVGMVNVPALAGTRHSTSVPGAGACPAGAGPADVLAVEAIAVMSTKPLGSPPVQVIVSGWVRSMQVVPAGKQPEVLAATLWLVHLNAAAADETAMLAEKAPTDEPPGAVTV